MVHPCVLFPLNTLHCLPTPVDPFLASFTCPKGGGLDAQCELSVASRYRPSVSLPVPPHKPTRTPTPPIPLPRHPGGSVRNAISGNLRKFRSNKDLCVCSSVCVYVCSSLWKPRFGRGRGFGVGQKLCRGEVCDRSMRGSGWFLVPLPVGKRVRNDWGSCVAGLDRA